MRRITGPRGLRRLAAVCLLGLLIGGGPPANRAEAQAPAVDPRAWKELNIVPMPKALRFTGKEAPLDPANVALVLGERKSRQSVIGAEWINKRIAELGGRPLPILVEGRAPTSSLAIVIGARSDNPLIEAAAQAKLVNVGENNPGERGYEVRASKDGKRVYLAGADNMGALYACVTFAELLKRKGGAVVWRGAEVRDWPTVIWITLGGSFFANTTSPELIHTVKNMWRVRRPTPSHRRAYLDAIKPVYDHLLRRKVTLMSYDGLTLRGKAFEPTAGCDIVREGMRYGQERGIEGVVLSQFPFVARADRYPKAASSNMGLKDAGPHPYYKAWIRCWSMDDLRRKTARELAQWVRAIGLTHIGFHDTDTGGLDNPAQWEQRCATCRKRWGDDYAAAIINKHKIYYDEIKKLNPNARVHFTVYPYHSRYVHQDTLEDILKRRLGDTALTRKLAKRYKARYSDFYRRLHKGFPVEDVTFVIREAPPAAVRAFRRLTPGRGILTWYALLYWRSLFSQAPAWTGTFCDNTRDVFYVRYQDEFVPLAALAVREYSWNPNAPGAEPWRRAPEGLGQQWRQAEPKGPIFELVLPRITRNFFGPAAGPYVAEAASQNVDFTQIFGRARRALKLKGSGRFQWQADGAERGAKALDSLWAECVKTKTRMGMDRYAFPRFVILREQFHMGMCMARARAQNLLARELAMKQDMSGAEKAVEAGLEAVRQGVASRKRLLAERPTGTILTRKDFNRWAGGWRGFSADRADFSKIEKTLKQTRSALKELGALGAAPKRILDTLAKRRLVRAHRTASPIVIDGKAEDSWKNAAPIESFLVLHQGARMASAHTRAKLLYDADNLYLLLSCWASGRAKVAGNDCAELFLMTPGLRPGYAHFFVYANGRLRQQLNKVVKIGAGTRTVPDNGWKGPGVEHAVRREADRWRAEIKIPMAAVSGAPGQRGWALNIARVAVYPGWSELSSILSPGARDFHDTKSYRSLLWTKEPFPRLSATIEAPGFRLTTETLPDTTATVASFQVQLDADRTLHDVTIEAEAYDAVGKLCRRRTLVRLGRVVYHWESTERYRLEYQQVESKGGVLLKLTCAEGNGRRWVRFGGWKGAGGKGGLFSPAADGTAGLAAPCYLADRVLLNGREQLLLHPPAGTLEFWVTPSWDGRWLPPFSRGEIRTGGHVFVHYGPVRPSHPRHTNNSPLTLAHLASQGILAATAYGSNHAGWASAAPVRSDPRWAAGVPHHVACVWDAAAEPDNRLRLYIDGKGVAGVAWRQHKDRLPATPKRIIDVQTSRSIQFGSLNSGWTPARAVIHELRLSRKARYTKDFTPVRGALAVDKDTTALFHFNGSLAGEGMTAKGERYKVQAQAGVMGYR